jgi:hypothetical protein
VLLYFIKGQLPWQGIPARTKKEKYEKIKDKKLSTQIDQLCKNLPEEIGNYLDYCRSMKFEEKPDIGYLRKLFKDLPLIGYMKGSEPEHLKIDKTETETEKNDSK